MINPRSSGELLSQKQRFRRSASVCKFNGNKNLDEDSEPEVEENSFLAQTAPRKKSFSTMKFNKDANG